MSESIAELLATDALLDQLARRQSQPGEPVLAELAALAHVLDSMPLPPLVTVDEPSPLQRSRRGSWALVTTVALTLATSGVAAAVTTDPLAPIHYVTHQIAKIGPHNDGRLPGWELEGAMPLRHLAAIRSQGSQPNGNRLGGAAVDSDSGSAAGGTGALTDSSSRPGSSGGEGSGGAHQQPPRLSGGHGGESGNGGRHRHRPGRVSGGRPTEGSPSGPQMGHQHTSRSADGGHPGLVQAPVSSLRGLSGGTGTGTGTGMVPDTAGEATSETDAGQPAAAAAGDLADAAPAGDRGTSRPPQVQVRHDSHPGSVSPSPTS